MTGSRVVLYIPGLDGTGALLYRQPRLQEKYQLVCCSYAQETTSTYEEMVEQAAETLRQATQGKPGLLLAESFGGAVGLQLALKYPELVERMILVNTFARFPKRGLIFLGRWFSYLFPNRPSPPSSRSMRAKYFFSPEVTPETQAEWWKRTGNVPMKAMGYRIRLLAGVNLLKQLPKLTIPALIVAAPDDRVVPPRAGKMLHQLLPNSVLIEPRVGHAAMVHPLIDVVEWLENPAYWPSSNAFATASEAEESREG